LVELGDLPASTRDAIRNRMRDTALEDYPDLVVMVIGKMNFLDEPSTAPCELTTMPHARHIHRWYCAAQRRRAHHLHIEALCRFCQEAGRVTPATVADHVEPDGGEFTAFWLGRLRSHCANRHNIGDRISAHLPASSARKYPE
jgi:hypothetical protein